MSAVESRFEALRTTNIPLFGRKDEFELLMQRWQKAKEGHGSVVLMSGEPGIGKSRIVHSVQDALATQPHTRLSYSARPIIRIAPCSRSQVSSNVRPALAEATRSRRS